MKSFALAALVAAGSLGFASTADAQYRSRVVYTYPTYTYTYPTYTYSYPTYTYSYPSYSYTTSAYTPITDTGVVVTSDLRIVQFVPCHPAGGERLALGGRKAAAADSREVDQIDMLMPRAYVF